MTGPLLAFYADDFTGASDVMNVLAGFGVRTSVYLTAPDIDDVPPETEAVGVAGLSRSLNNHDLRQQVTSALAALAKLKPTVLQYKVCSTFDSSPELGNIGLALQCGQRVTGQRSVPVIVAAPQLRRYVVFGNLFAAAGNNPTIYRLDQHPTMATHPSTPMHQADIGAHLRELAGLSYRHLDITSIRNGNIAVDVDGGEPDAVIYDSLTPEDLTSIGTHLLDARAPLFVIGSSGASWAFLAGAGRTENTEAVGSRPDEAQTLVVSASQSPTTSHQLDFAAQAGFATVTVEVNSEQSWLAAERFATHALAGGRNVIVETSRANNATPTCPISRGLSQIARSSLTAQPHLRRLVICGGDTSGEVATDLGITRFDFSWSLDPGAPFTTVASANPIIDGLSVVFKGGQMGQPDILDAARKGGR